MRLPRAVVVLVVAVLAGLVLVTCGDDDDSGGGGGGETVDLSVDTSEAPWPRGDNQVARIEAAGLPALKREALEVHYHDRLAVFVDGEAVEVPANIGIDLEARRISTLHTHGAGGVVHVESPTDDTFTLGQLFIEWGVRLTDTCVGAYCSPDTPIALYVDGDETSTPLPDVAFRGDQQLSLVIGTPPATIPDSFSQG